MPCSDVDGTYRFGIVIPDAPRLPEKEPNVTFSPVAGGGIVGQYVGDTKDFQVTCSNIGPLHAAIHFRREHDDGTETEYTGLVTHIVTATEDFVRIRGRYKRTTTTLITTNGDWETEKPT